MNIVKAFAETFDEKGCSLKLMEEMAELNEVLIKRITKIEELKPPIEKVIEEMGDLCLRMEILQEKLGIKDEVNKRIEEKSFYLKQWFSKTYPNVAV